LYFKLKNVLISPDIDRIFTQIENEFGEPQSNIRIKHAKCTTEQLNDITEMANNLRSLYAEKALRIAQCVTGNNTNNNETVTLSNSTTTTTTTLAPNVTTTLAPNMTTTLAPNVTTTLAPNITTTLAPNVTIPQTNETETFGFASCPVGGNDNVSDTKERSL
jgi:hypothetical protein